MKKNEIFYHHWGIGISCAVLIAADHIDAPSVSGTTADITDFCVFQGVDPNNLVFLVNVQGILAHGEFPRKRQY